MMRAVCVLLALAASGQTPDGGGLARQAESVARQRQALDEQGKSLEALHQSVVRQRAAARRQAGVEAPGGEPGFFTVPWPETPAAPALAAAFRSGCQPLEQSALDPIVERASRLNALAPELVRAVIRQETGGLPCAVSRAGAMGLMQLMPATAGELGVSNPFDAEQNISGGSRLLRTLLDRYGGDLRLALGAYNSGPARVDSAGDVPGIPETQDYVKEILKLVLR
jgi:soluble lytic murein transglycosylase-like protein